MLLFQDNDEICIQLGLCNSTNVAAVGRVSLTAKPQSPEAGILCVICEFVMKELESILINNATEVRYPPTSDLSTLVCSIYVVNTIELCAVIVVV